MLALKIENTALDMPADERLRVVLSCPLFDRDKIVRTFSQPFQVPLTPRNKRVLRHVERFDAGGAWGARECQLWLGGGQYERGELVSLGSGEAAIDVVFRNLPVTVMEDLKKIYLNEILDTIAITESGGGKQAYFLMDAPPTEYTIVFGGNTYNLGTIGSTGMTKQDVAEYLRDAINADFPGTATATIDSLVLDTDKVNEFGANWTALVGMTITSYNPPGTVYMRSFHNYVEDLVATPADEVCFPFVVWENFYDNKNALTRSRVNPVFDATAWLNEYTDDAKAWWYSFVPALKLPYLLEKVRAAAGIGYLAGWLIDDADAQSLIWLSERSCDQVYRDFTEDNLYEYINGFEQSINLNKHVPKMTAWDFLYRVASGLNLLIEYRDGGLHFRRALDLVSPSPEDWSGYIDPRRYNRELKKPEGVRLYYSETEGEAYDDGGQLDPYQTLSGGVQSEMPFRTMAMEIYSELLDSVPGALRAPHTKRVGKCPAYGQDTASLPMHLLFDRGVKESAGGKEYVYATHDEMDIDGTTVIGTLSLALEGDYGLVAVQYGATINYNDLGEMSVTAIVPENEVYRLKRWENARIYFYHPNGMVTLVVRAVEFDVSGRESGGWVEARVRGVKE